jgi:hypothetical protein
MNMEFCSSADMKTIQDTVTTWMYAHFFFPDISEIKEYFLAAISSSEVNISGTAIIASVHAPVDARRIFTG